LAFGVVAVALRGQRDGLVAAKLATQNSDGLGVAERGEGSAFEAIGFDELGGLFDQAAVEHLGGAAVDAGVEGWSGRIEAQPEDAVAGERVAGLLLPLLGDGLPGGEGNFDGADDFWAVVGVDEGGGCGVEASKDAVEVGGAFLGRAGAEFFAERLVALGRGEEAVEQRAQVKAGASGDDRQHFVLFSTLFAREYGWVLWIPRITRRYIWHPPLADSGDSFAGEAAVVAGGAGFVGGEDVDEVVRDAGALGQSGFSGADLHAAVDGDRVAGDDFAGEALGQGEGEGGFAAGSRAAEDDERRVATYQRRHQPRVKTLWMPAR